MMGGGFLLIVAVVVLVIWLAGGVGPRRPEDTSTERDADEILAQRFARGEISEDEFEQRRRALERRPF